MWTHIKEFESKCLQTSHMQSKLNKAQLSRGHASANVPSLFCSQPLSSYTAAVNTAHFFCGLVLPLD